MKIQARLNIIAGSIILTLFITLAVVYIVQQPIEHMDDELDIMNELESSLLNFQATLNAFNTVSFRGHMSLWEVDRRLLEESFDKLNDITYLVNINDDVAEAVENTIKLQNLLKLRMDKIEESLPVMYEMGNKVYGPSIPFTILNIYYDVVTSSDNEDYVLLFQQARKFTGNLAILNQGIISTLVSVANHQKKISELTLLIKRNTRLIALSVFLFGIAISLIISRLLSKDIVRNIQYFCESTNQLARGDLTQEISVNSKGEFSTLAQDMMLLQHQFGGSLEKIQNVALRNEAMKQELLAMAEETSRTSEQIQHNSKSIEDQMNGLTGDLDHTNSATEIIRNRVDRLNESVLSQIALVEQSAAAVQHMINSIEGVSQKTTESREAADGLVKTSQEGGDKLKATLDTISQVGDHIGEIKKMVTMINSIAAQTNLLAMNAAIESAHAGDAGRGFSVVADEIRKLAEAAGGNSKEIGDSLKRITKAIVEAEESGRVTMDSFHVIEGFVERVSAAFKDIDSNMSELSSGSTEILSSTKELTSITQTVKEGSGEIQINADKISADVQKITQVGYGVSNSIKEISGGISHISESVGDINQVSQGLGELSTELTNEVMVFRTKGNQSLREQKTQEETEEIPETLEDTMVDFNDKEEAQKESSKISELKEL